MISNQDKTELEEVMREIDLLKVQCAWCSRWLYRDANGNEMFIEPQNQIASHTICGSCKAKLREQAVKDGILR